MFLFNCLKKWNRQNRQRHLNTSNVLIQQAVQYRTAQSRTDLNTSNVLIQHGFISNIVWNNGRFKYIKCSYSTNFQKCSLHNLKYLNTSNVLIQPILEKSGSTSNSI